MQTTAMSSNVLQTRTCTRTNSFKPARAGVQARKPVIVRAQAEQKAHGPAKVASAALAAVAAAQFAFSGAALAIDPPVLGGKPPQIFSPKDAQDIQAGQGQTPSDKYVSQAREATGSDTAANMAATAPTINKKGGGVGRADFAPSQQLQGLRGETQTPPDVRKGTPDTKAPMWMNAMPDLSAAPIASPDAEADNDGKVLF